MSIYPQPNSWQCGPFALKYALLALGRFEREADISEAAGTDETGTDEVELGRAALRYDCDLLMVRRHDPGAARQELRTFLRRGIPTLLCINQWNHWITVVREEDDEFVFFDSHDAAVVRLVPWRQLRELWLYRASGEDGRGAIYDLHPLVPRRRPRLRPRFTRATARYLRREEHRPFARRWGEYVRDLVAFANPRTGPQDDLFCLAMTAFLDRHRDDLVAHMTSWHRPIAPAVARRVVDQMRLVAETYDLVIFPHDETRLLDALSVMFALRAVAAYGGPAARTGEPAVR